MSDQTDTSFNYPQIISKLVIYLSNPSKFISSIVLVYHTHKELLYTLKILHLCVTQRTSWKSERDTVPCIGYTVLVLRTNKFINNTNQINSRIIIKAFFYLM